MQGSLLRFPSKSLLFYFVTKHDREWQEDSLRLSLMLWQTSITPRVQRDFGYKVQVIFCNGYKINTVACAFLLLFLCLCPFRWCDCLSNWFLIDTPRWLFLNSSVSMAILGEIEKTKVLNKRRRILRATEWLLFPSGQRRMCDKVATLSRQAARTCWTVWPVEEEKNKRTINSTVIHLHV